MIFCMSAIKKGIRYWKLKPNYSSLPHVKQMGIFYALWQFFRSHYSVTSSSKVVPSSNLVGLPLEDKMDSM